MSRAALSAAVSRLARLCLWLSAGGLVVMTAVIGWQVWGRYVLNDTPHWSERLSLLLMIYYILFAAAVGVRERFHLGLSLLHNALPPRAQRLQGIAVSLIVGGFGAGMVWYGARMVASTWSHTIPTLGLPTGLSYLPFPLAGGLIVLFIVEQLLAPPAPEPEPEPVSEPGPRETPWN